MTLEVYSYKRYSNSNLTTRNIIPFLVHHVVRVSLRILWKRMRLAERWGGGRSGDRAHVLLTFIETLSVDGL